MKAIVIYCSKGGKTEAIAKKIQSDIPADILKVEPAVEYGGFLTAARRAGKEKKAHLDVAFKTEVPDLSEYDTVFVGYPIWAGTTPYFFKTFLKNCALKGKTLIPFCTSKKTSIVSSIPDVKEACPGALIKEGLAYGVSGRDTYENWISRIPK